MYARFTKKEDEPYPGPGRLEVSAVTGGQAVAAEFIGRQGGRPRIHEKSHYHTSEAAFLGDWRWRYHGPCSCTLAVTPTYRMGQLPGELTLRAECNACRRTRLWTRLSLRLGIPVTEAMDIAYDATHHVLPGIFGLLDSAMCEPQLGSVPAA